MFNMKNSMESSQLPNPPPSPPPTQAPYLSENRNAVHAICFCPSFKMCMCKLQNISVEIVKYVFPKWKNIFVQFRNVFPKWKNIFVSFRNILQHITILCKIYCSQLHVNFLLSDRI